MKSPSSVFNILSLVALGWSLACHYSIAFMHTSSAPTRTGTHTQRRKLQVQESTSSSDNNALPVFKLYILQGGMCPYAARTWITMLELGLPFDLVEVSAMEKEPWFLEINPRGKVPAVQNVQDRTVVYESAICDEYLADYAREIDVDMDEEETHTPHMRTTTTRNKGTTWKLMPMDAGDKAAMRLLNDHMDTQLGPAQYTYLMNDDPSKDPELMDNLEVALEVLQTSLIQRGGPYLMGSAFTLADVHVLPFFLRLVVSLQHFKGYTVPHNKFAYLLQWYDLCSQRESVQTTAKTDEEIIQVYQKFVDMKYKFGGLNKNTQ